MVDLRKAKPGDVYIDGRGHIVRIVCIDRKDCTESNFSVVALKDIDGYEEIETYTIEGSYWGLFTESYKQYDLVKRIEVVNDEQKLSAQQYLISKGYPVNTGGEIPTYEELYEIIKDGIIDAIKKTK